MGREIERKFLVNKEKLAGYSLSFMLAHKIKQGYLLDDGNKTGLLSIRARIIDNKGYLTIKKRTLDPRIRFEYEYPIPVEDAEELLENSCPHGIIEKERIFIQKEGKHVWEIDIFQGDNEGLIIAELELDSADEEFVKPDFVGKEVTGYARYLNTNLAIKPYKDWKEDEK